MGIILATHLTHKIQKLWKITIYTDNQTAIKALEDISNKPRSYLLHHIIQVFKQLHKKHKELSIEIQWVLGHKGIVGNEKENEGAKKAAREGLSEKNELPMTL